jgi:hypothetical protein
MSSSDLQEFQALCLLQALFVWHGTQEHRSLARERLHPIVVKIARRLNLQNTLGYGHPHCSALHEPGPFHEQPPFVWARWVEQEARIRTLYLNFLLDVAFSIFFNAAPQFDSFEIKIPLPADDAAFEAKNENECARALGLQGQAAQESINLSGTRRRRQIPMSDALRFLLQHQSDFTKRSTNAFSKFILIHALHAQIWNIQSQCTQPEGFAHTGMGYKPSASGASTPISANDWVASDGTISTSTSGRATPTELSPSYPPQALQQLRMVTNALEKWYRAWVGDMEEQYPLTPSHGFFSTRVGFCRDAVHFYFLARHFIRNTHPREWQIASEQRMQQVFQVLNGIKNQVANEQERRGEEVGSIARVDDSYTMGDERYAAGVESITLDMKQLFTPMSARSSIGSSV